MTEQEFYEQCASLLGVPHEYHEPTHVPTMPDREGNIRNTYKNRYNGRTPGNGRFVGRGLIRNFGSLITVNLTNPSLRGSYADFDEALQAIGSAVGIPVRLMSEAEIEECRRLTKEAHEKVAAAVEERGGILFCEKIKARQAPLSIMAQQALKRPPNYANLSSADQWRIDRELGILDWDGT